VEFQGLGHRAVKAAFDGGHISSDGGVLLLREADGLLKLTEQFAACFTDYRVPDKIEHSVLALLRQRVYGVALGHEDLNDHDDLMRDPLIALAVGKTDPEGAERRREQDRGKALASSSTLNRLELTPADADAQNRYKKIVCHPEKVEALFVDVFLDSFAQAPEEIILDFDATDDPLHGNQEGRFYHGYYGCYCYLPLYVTCGDHLLVAKLRKADIDASAGSKEVLAYLVERIRARWPQVRIIARADSGFARDDFMTWCEENDVYYVIGLAKNSRLLQKIGKELVAARDAHRQTGEATRVFTQFSYRTRKSWSCSRLVIAKAEHLSKGPNPRFIVVHLPKDYATPQAMYEKIYCARGEMENRIKEQQLDLFADRTSTHLMTSNQLRLWFSSLAYVLLSAMRRVALKDTRLAKATCGTIRVKLLKIGAQVTVSVRRFFIHLASGCPYQDVFAQACRNLQQCVLRC
jgi:hypothetical protein